MATATTAAIRKTDVKEYTYIWEGLDRQGRQVRGEVKAAIEFLFDYAAIHFETEARYMRAAAFPGERLHLAEHALLDRELRSAAEAWAAEGESPALAREVAELLENWLVGHIHEHDRLLATWLLHAARPGPG
jgi:hemerythrin-like metal-binding protein